MPSASETEQRRHLVATTLDEQRATFEAFVRARVRPDEVEDLLQRAALRAMESADRLDDPERVEAWLHRIHRNLVIDTYRGRASEDRHLDRDSAVPERAGAEVDDPCSCSVVQAARLPASYATILSMVDTAGVELRDAARELEITPNNAAVRLHRARKALRQAMLDHCGVTDPRDCGVCPCVDDACCAA